MSVRGSFGIAVVALACGSLVFAAPPRPPLPYGVRSGAPANVEHLTGYAAQRVLASLKIQHKGVFEKAAQMMARRGFSDTGVVEVLRTPRAIRQAHSGRRPPYYRVDTASGVQGEIVYWSWDDGDQTTWEGNVFLHEYPTDNWINFNGQFSVIYGNEWTMYWDDLVAATDGGGGGPDDQYARSVPSIPFNCGFAYTKNVIWPERFVQSPYDRTAINWTRVQQKVVDWAWCAAFGCAGTTYTCQTLSPTPREKALCSAAACIAIGIGCLYVLI